VGLDMCCESISTLRGLLPQCMVMGVMGELVAALLVAALPSLFPL